MRKGKRQALPSGHLRGEASGALQINILSCVSPLVQHVVLSVTLDPVVAMWFSSRAVQTPDDGSFMGCW